MAGNPSIRNYTCGQSRAGKTPARMLVCFSSRSPLRSAVHAVTVCRRGPSHTTCSQLLRLRGDAERLQTQRGCNGSGRRGPALLRRQRCALKASAASSIATMHFNAPFGRYDAPRLRSARLAASLCMQHESPRWRFYREQECGWRARTPDDGVV